MLSLQEDEPPEDVGEQTLGESSSSKKKRSHLNGKSQPPSAKRLKLAGGAVEPPKKSERRRTSVAKTRGTGFDNPTKPTWSAVAGPGSPRKNPEQAQIDVRPRLWSSNREELGSTFTEISASKCVNNVSWTSTDMPILILDNEFISLDNPEIGDRLCMDVTFIRQFVCASEDVRPQPPDIPLKVANIKQEDTPRSTNSSCAQPTMPAQRVDPANPQECQEQIQAAQVLSEEQHPPGPLATSAPLEGPSASEGSTLATTKDPPPIPVIVKVSNSKPGKTQPRQKRTTQPLRKEPLPPLAPGSKLPQELAQEKKATGALSSLRFKKNKPTPYDSPHDSGASQVSHQSLFPTLSPVSDSPQSANASGSQLLGASASQPSKQARAEKFCQLPAPYPPGPAVLRSPQPSETLPENSTLHNSQPSHPPSRWGPPPEKPAARQNTVISDQTNFDPLPQYYPDNRFLPKLNNFPDIVFQKLDVPASTSFTHYPVRKFKIDSEQLGESAQREGSHGVTVGTTITEPSVATQCCCSRFRYDPQCPFCGDIGEARKYTPPPERNPVQRGTQVKSETGQREQFLGVPVGLRMMSNWSNNTRLGKRRPRGALQAQSVDETPDIPSRPLIGPRSPPHDWTKLPTFQNITDTLDVEARSQISPPLPSPAPVTIGNTASQAIGGQSVVTIPPHAFESSKRHFTKLHGPGLTGESRPLTERVPLLRSCAPAQAPTTLITNDGAKELTTSIDSASLPLLDQVTATTGNTISSSLKRKGKERCREPESSDDEPLSVRVGRQHTAKKAKLRHERIVNGHHMPSIQVCQSTMTIACSSKTRLEDLPILAPGEHVPTKNGVRVADSSGPRIEHPPQAPIPLISTKSIKRRGRPAKNTKPAPSATPQLPTDDISKPVDSDVPQQAPRAQPEPPLGLSISASKPKFHATKPKPKSQRSPLAPISSIPRKDNGVPVSIPDEIQALVDAYITGMPVGIFAAKQQIESFWGLKFPQGEEIGYAFMGFYRVSRMWECLIEGEVDASGGDGVDKARGKRPVEGIAQLRVRWRFRMRWEPGGEDWQVRERDKLSSPWWNPALKPRGLSMLPQPNLEDSDDESTIAYRTGRRKNPNFARRHCFFNQAFFSVLPLHLLAPVLTEIPDSAFPRGWHCEDCGKLNFRYHLRHRQCSSSYCKDKPEIEGYAVDIDRLRDPQDALPLSLPLNELPGNVPCGTKVQVWKDRTKTLVYRLGISGDENAESTVVRHIFTCNLKDLQMEASELLNTMQKDVPLRRVPAETNPYFVYHAGDSDGEGGKFVPWRSVPKCLQRAQELMNDRGRKYGRRSAAELNIRQLVIWAWVIAGNKRGSDLLRAKQRCIAIMCLGCEVIMSISPKSVMASNGDQARIPDLDKLTPMEGFDPQDVKLEIAPLVESGIGVKGETETTPMDTDDQVRSASAVSTKVGAEAKRVERTVLSVSLVHGDLLLLEGEDFEYAIKRTGTSILLFGS